jgi:hypothetical protein
MGSNLCIGSEGESTHNKSELTLELNSGPHVSLKFYEHYSKYMGLNTK